MMPVPAGPLAYEQKGAAGSPVVVLLPGLGTRRSVLGETARLLSADHRVLSVDLPGHGASPLVDQAYRLEDVAGSVVALLDHLGIEVCTVLGLSVSGAIGQALALASPERMRRLVLVGTAAHWPDPESWRERAARVRAEGVGFMAPSRQGTWYSDDFAAAHPGRTAEILADLTTTDPESYALCCDAIRSFDARAHLGDIATPTTVVVGDRDTATPPALAAELHEGIPGSRLHVVRDGYHLLPLEHPGLMAQLVDA